MANLANLLGREWQVPATICMGQSDLRDDGPICKEQSNQHDDGTICKGQSMVAPAAHVFALVAAPQDTAEETIDSDDTLYRI